MISDTCFFTTGMLIRRFRIQAGMSQRELALEIDVSETTLSKWETDISKPSPLNLNKLEQALGATIRPGYQDLGNRALPQDRPQIAMNAGALRSLRAEVEFLNTHVQLLAKLLRHMEPETV